MFKNRNYNYGIKEILLVFFILIAFSQLYGQHDWEINPPDYQFSGEVNAVVIFNEAEVSSGSLGAFLGDECRGIANEPIYFGPTGRYIFSFLTYSNSANGEVLTFKYYNDIDGQTYDINETVTFLLNMQEGDAFDPLIFNTISSELTIITIDIKVILEGAFSPGNGNLMRTTLNSEIPLNQPYEPSLPYFGNNNPKWYYTGDESVDAMPTNVVDWVLVELRDAAAPNQATVTLEKQAALLLNTGHIVGTDGQTLVFNVEIEQGLYVVVYHRNHLGVMSSQALTQLGGVYTWDFTQALDKAYVKEERAAYQNGQKSLPGGFFGMYGGDGDGDGQVLLQDLLNVLNPQSGQSGYRAGDFDLDGQVLLQDLLNILNPNSGIGSQVP